MRTEREIKERLNLLREISFEIGEVGMFRVDAGIKTLLWVLNDDSVKL